MKIDFIGIGAHKAGTTTLSRLLEEHPDICLAIRKEVLFFSALRNPFDPEPSDDRYPRGFDWYARHFDHCAADSVKGEFSPVYFVDTEAPKRIREALPDVKLIACLRDPVKRAFSMYQMRTHRRGDPGVSFGEMIRGPQRFACIEPGLYHKHLSRWLALFPRDQLFVVVLEDFQEQPEQTMRALYGFLGVDADFVPPSLHRRLNTPKSFRFLGLRRLKGIVFQRLVDSGNAAAIERLRKLGVGAVLDRLVNVPAANPVMDPEDAAHLREVYAADTAALEELLGHDLTHWGK